MRRYSMKSLKRKNHQRWFNQYCRFVNKQIENDELWLGRFCVKQLRSNIHWFDDKSGGLMTAEILMRDKKTGITRTGWYTGIDMDWRFWTDLNDFIITDCKVWSEKPDPYESKIDFRRVK